MKLFLFALVLALCATVNAQTYPTKTVCIVVPFVPGGNVDINARAVATDKRAPLLPDVPTLAEQGLKGFDATTTTGLLAPAATPQDIIERVHGAIVKIAAPQTIRDRFAALGATTLGNSPAAFAEYIKQDYAKWQKVVQAANISAN